MKNKSRLLGWGEWGAQRPPQGKINTCLNDTRVDTLRSRDEIKKILFGYLSYLFDTNTNTETDRQTWQGSVNNKGDTCVPGR